jgi:hypothetical protein
MPNTTCFDVAGDHAKISSNQSKVRERFSFRGSVRRNFGRFFAINSASMRGGRLSSDLPQRSLAKYALNVHKNVHFQQMYVCCCFSGAARA